MGLGIAFFALWAVTSQDGLFPEIEPYTTGFLQVSARHNIYYETLGNPKGSPLVFLHGGPGSGASLRHRQLFDPSLYHIIIFDQRGCGRSIPQGETQENTTPHLLEDMEKIRTHLNIEKWVVAGGSWGSTLALLYAEHYPQNVKALLLWSVFLGTRAETQWAFGEAKNIYPFQWEQLSSHVNVQEAFEITKAYHTKIFSVNQEEAKAAAKIWVDYENALSTAGEEPPLEELDDKSFNIAKMESHYFMHHIFFEDNYILKKAVSLSSVPGVIIHGDQDHICPLLYAVQLNQKWPSSVLHIVKKAAHGIDYLDIRQAILDAGQKLSKL